MARTYFHASSTGQTNRGSGAGTNAYIDKVSLTIPAGQQVASTAYYVFWGALSRGNSTGAGVFGKSRLRNDTAAADMQEYLFTDKDTTDWRPVGGCMRWTSAGTPVDQEFSIEFANSNTSTQNSAIKEAWLFVLKHETGDVYAEATAETSTASAAYQDKVTLSFTPASAGDYLFFASMRLRANTTGAKGTAIHDGSGVIRERDPQIVDADDEFLPIMELFKGTNLSGAQTWKSQYQSNGTNSTSVSQASIVGLRLDTFPGTPQYAESNAASTKTGAGSDSHSDKASVTFTPAAVDHLILSSSHIGANTTTASVAAQVAEDGTALQAEMLKEPIASDTAVPLREAHFVVHVFEPTAASHTYATQYRNETTANTAAIAESAIAVLQLEAAGGAPIEKSGSDTLLPMTTEAVSALLASLSRSDTALPMTAETVDDILASLSRTETLLPMVSEALTIVATLNRSDTLPPRLDDQASVAAIIAAADSLAITVDDAAEITALLMRVDALPITLGEVVTILAALDREDTVALTLGDVASILAVLSVTDQLLVTLGHTATVEEIVDTIQKTASDTVALSLVEQAAILALLSRSDDLAPTVGEAASLLYLFQRADTLGIALDEVVTILAQLDRIDALGISVDEQRVIAASLERADAVDVALSDSAATLMLHTVSDALGISLAEAAALLKVAVAEPRAENILELARQRRVATLPAESRVLTLAPAPRSVSVPAEPRFIEIPRQPRTLQ